MTTQWEDGHRMRFAVGAALGVTMAIVASLLIPALAAGAAAAATLPSSTAKAADDFNCAASVSGLVLSRSGWTAGTNAPSGPTDAPWHALDGNSSTRFSSDEDQASGLYFKVDLGSAQAFDELVMSSSGSPTDYARGYEVELSDNDSSWSTVASCQGTSDSEVISFPTQTAKYVKVILTTGVKFWWSIDEFYLYGAPNCAASMSGEALSRSGWTAASNAPSSSTDAPWHALDGNWSTRFSTDAYQASGQYFQVDLGSAVPFDELVMGMPNSPTDYARSYDVQLSDNDSSWYTVASCQGTSDSEVISFPTQTAKYVKVILTTGVKFWWSIDEFYLYGSGLTTATTTTTTTLTTPKTDVFSSANPVALGSAVTYTAEIVPKPKGGSVSFLDQGVALPGCSNLPVNTASGEATCSTTYYSAGDQRIQVYFSGYSPFQPSVSAPYEEVVELPAAGYWLATSNGQVYGSGAAPSLGGLTTSAGTGPVVGIAGTPTAKGYWVVTADGTVATFGDATFYGDLPALGKHVSDIVAIAPTSDGKGYYLVGADGGFFTFGDATFHGSLPGAHIHVRDVVGMVGTPGGAGYLLVGADGGVFTFGLARFYGSLPGIHRHVRDIRAILPSSTGRGYVLVGADGGAFIFGTGVQFHGSLPGEGVRVANIVGIALSPDNGGYYMAGADGRVYGFGDAQAAPEPLGLSDNLPVAAIAGT